VGLGSCRIGPALFNRACSVSRLEVVQSNQTWLYFFVYLCSSILCSGRMFAFVVLGLDFSVLAKRLAGKNISKKTPFCVEWDGYWTTRGHANSQIANSRTGHLMDWSTRGLVNSRT